MDFYYKIDVDYQNLIFLCRSFLQGFILQNLSGLNVVRCLTASLRGPVLTLRRGLSPS